MLIELVSPHAGEAGAGLPDAVAERWKTRLASLSRRLRARFGFHGFSFMTAGGCEVVFGAGGHLDDGMLDSLG